MNLDSKVRKLLATRTPSNSSNGTKKVIGIIILFFLLQSAFLIEPATVLAAGTESILNTPTGYIPTVPATGAPKTDSTEASTQQAPQQSAVPSSPLSAVTTASTVSTVTTYTITASSNNNFSFTYSDDGTTQKIYLNNKTTGSQTFLVSAPVSNNYISYDVDPWGKYAYVNTATTSGSSVTGKTQVFDIARNVFTTVNQVSDSTGASLGQVSSIVGAGYGLRFTPSGYVLMTLFTQNSTTRTFWSSILNLNVSSPRYTKLPFYQGSGDTSSSSAPASWYPLFTPQGDKMIFGGIAGGYTQGNAISGYAVGIYNVANGSFTSKVMSGLTTYNGIKGISADGNTAIVASLDNKFSAVTLRDTKAAIVTTISIATGRTAAE